MCQLYADGAATVLIVTHREIQCPEMHSTVHCPFAEPIEVARCILFLASNDASFVTGSVMVADGGYTTK